MKSIIIINGPNINMLSHRSQEIYGSFSYDQLIKECEDEASYCNLKVSFFQSNSEGEIVSMIQKVILDKEISGIIINPAAFSHSSIAIYDALEITNLYIIEVHISNLYKREEIRHNLITAKASKGVITGFGLDSYKMAINMMSKWLNKKI